MKSVENEWERTAMKMQQLQLRKTTAEWQKQQWTLEVRNSSSPRASRRIIPPVALLQRVCRSELGRCAQQICFFSPFYFLCSMWRRPTSLQLKEPTSPRIVTNKQHSKHTWMRPIVLSIHSFIKHPNHLTVPRAWSKSFWKLSLSRELSKEQYLGSLKTWSTLK